MLMSLFSACSNGTGFPNKTHSCLFCPSQEEQSGISSQEMRVLALINIALRNLKGQMGEGLEKDLC